MTSPVISIDSASLQNAEICLKIIGGVISSYDKRRHFDFQVTIDGKEYLLNKDSLKLIRHMYIKRGLTTRGFHNAFELALGLELNSTIL